ncbi:MAG TPA: tripartite tricarboxylate transporter substrate binding protein [Burkholderiales bacterium]|nr:tripartite tricarboxylate transporter substrate binding protein [Burkholderiales bacterium]
MRPRKIFATLAAVALCVAAPAVLAQGAAGYPTKPIRMIVPFTPGSATDVMGRLVAERLTAAWGQPVVVDNKPGAGGTIGIRETARAEPDGYTIVVVSSGHAVNHVLYKDLGYDTLKDFAGVALLGSLPSVLIVPPSLGVKTVKELVAAAKAKPGEFNYATAGVGSGAHVSIEKFNVATGIKAVHVPLKGTPPILTETMAGRVQYGYVPAVSGMGVIKEGKVTPLAVSTAKRIDALPDVPTIAEAGFPEAENTFWVAMLAPAKTPRDIVAKLNAEVNRALQAPDMKEKLAKLGTEPMQMTPEELDRFVASEYRDLGEVMVKAGLKPQ